jgi:hypothetical protein
LTADRAAGRRGEHRGDAVHARDAEHLALDVERDERAHVRIELPHLAPHRHRLNAADLLEADAGVAVDHAGVDELVLRVDDLRVIRGDVRAHLHDTSVANENVRHDARTVGIDDRAAANQIRATFAGRRLRAKHGGE